MEKLQETIAELAGDRINRIPFSPSMKRVIKPRSADELSDVGYTEQDRAEYEEARSCRS